MMKFIVKAIIRTTETWEVIAHDEAQTCELFEEGQLLNTAAYELERIHSIEPAYIAAAPS